MPSRSRSASRSSTSGSRARRALLAGLAVALPLVAAERRRHRLAEHRLTRQAAAREAQLRSESDDREAERARLTAQLITAEQDERRRLSVALHDGPLGALAGIALIHDAALAALRDGQVEEATCLIEKALERERTTIQSLRDLSFSMEPIILRDESFAVALRALTDQLERASGIAVELDADDGELLGEKAQVALYQTLREALTQAARRRPTRIAVAVTGNEDGGFDVTLVDDGVAERRLASREAIAERARLLGGRVELETGEHGSAVRIAIPPYVAAHA